MKQTAWFWTLALCFSAAARGETATIPGEVNSLCYYGNFFYNLPEKDFFYYFNDALLFTEPPDDTVYQDGMRDKYLRLARRHSEVKEYIKVHGNRQNETISFDLGDKGEFSQAAEFLALLGLELKASESGKISVKPADEEFPVQYYAFCRLKPFMLQSQLQKTAKLFFKLQETAVNLPWDLEFLGSACGLKMDPGSFFEQLLANKRLSLLLAVLYRLSDKEIAWVGQRSPKDPGAAWRRIVLDKKALMGLFVLSNALRVRDGRLAFPGGGKAGKLWAELAGSDPETAPLDFLLRLCTLDSGKLNYLYVFSSLLPEEKRRVLLFDYDPLKVRRIYQKIALGDNEKIKANSFPRINNFSFFALLLAFQTKDNRIELPLGAAAWAQAMGMELPAGSEECGFLEKLLDETGGGGKPGLLHKFIALYSKFRDRLQLVSPEFLKKAFAGYERYHTLLDFIERIPLKKPESADALFAWQESLQKLPQKDRLLHAALGQALLETIAQAAAFAPVGIDFDAVVQDLAAIPWQRPAFCDGLFAFISRLGGLDSQRNMADDTYLNFILSGLKNQPVLLQGESYDWLGRDLYAAQLQEMMQAQEVATLKTLGELNVLLNELAAAPASPAGLCRRLHDALEQLPYPDFSKDAPRSLKERVMAYDKSDLDRDAQALVSLCERNADREKVRKAVDGFKGDYLLPNLKDHFLCLAYALNAKSPKLRIFMNPNLARLHDFSDSQASPWQEGSSPGNKTDVSTYHLKGGLSRLNLTFALNWRDQLFEKAVYNSEQTQGMIYNIMAMLPQPTAVHRQVHDALLVEFAVEMLQKCRSSEAMKSAVQEAGMAVTSGYHYRRLSDYLDGQSDDYHLFFTELRQFGLALAENPLFLEQFSQKDELAKYGQMPLRAVAGDEGDPWGSIHGNSFGSLAPRNGMFFPQEAAQLFAPGWLSGEILEEFKLKTSYLTYKNRLPSCLVGQFVFDFISSIGRSLYTQNHARDYHSAYFVLDVMNSGHLKKTLKRLQENGFLRLK